MKFEPLVRRTACHSVSILFIPLALSVGVLAGCGPEILAAVESAPGPEGTQQTSVAGDAVVADDAGAPPASQNSAAGSAVDSTTPPSVAEDPLADPPSAVTQTPASGDEANDQDHFLMVGGRLRSYRVHCPPLYDGTVPTPVVLSFHDGGGCVATHAAWTRLNDVADTGGFICVWPRGTAEPPYTEFFWNPGAGPDGPFFDDPYFAEVDDIGFVEALLDDLEARFNVDPSRVYATGFSNGALLVHVLGCRLSHRIAAIAPVAGPFWTFPDECAPSRPISVFYLHGTVDHCAPYDGGYSSCGVRKKDRVFVSAEETVSIWLEKLGCSSAGAATCRNGQVTCVTYEACDGGAEVTFCIVEGGGHTWPGGVSDRRSEISPTFADLSIEPRWRGRQGGFGPQGLHYKVTLVGPSAGGLLRFESAGAAVSEASGAVSPESSPARPPVRCSVA